MAKKSKGKIFDIKSTKKAIKSNKKFIIFILTYPFNKLIKSIEIPPRNL